ncbi:MAG: hypothetical protein FWB85_08640 [Chitinispirillia bacterium]|nr:hypothetical protein [Chitinispirillia bacterium]MCL2242315.1 hypothetical protein [Chitinispirillia bacterium]
MNKVSISDWKLERYLLGELPCEEINALRELELRDNELRARVAALREGRDVILAKFPPPAEIAGGIVDIIAAEHIKADYSGASGGTGRITPANEPAGVGGTEHLRESPMRQMFAFPRWAATAFACAALLILLPVWMMLSGTPSENRLKSGVDSEPMIEVWRKAGVSAEKLAPEAAVRTGDIVQLRYSVPAACYGALVSMDGRGVLTVHLAGDNGKAARLLPGHPVALNMSYQLDDAPAFEAFYLVTASDSFDLETLERTLKDADHPINNGKTLPLPQTQVTAFTLRK